MLHCSFGQVVESMQLCLAGDPESVWVLESLQQRALVFEQQEKNNYEVVRTPDDEPDRNIFVVLLHAKAQGVRNGNSMVFMDKLEAGNKGSFSALFVAQRECDPFWFGLKASAETLLYERALGFEDIKNGIIRDLEVMRHKTPRTRSEFANLRKESHAKLASYERETADMQDCLVYRALRRSFGDALDELIPRTDHRSDVRALREIYLQEVVRKLLHLTSKTFPEAASAEEDLARGLLIAAASTYLVDQVKRPVSTLN